jgi:glycosyltransferase involved in cell wall biosynthesis
MPETEEGQEVRRDGRSRPIVAVIPAYNEERYIGSVVLKTRKQVDTVVVVDDGSTDLTAEIAKAAGAIVVRHESKQGKGKALNTGFRRVRELDPAAIVMLDGDGQHMPQEVPQVLAPVLHGDADLVVGSRYLQKGNGVPRHRVWGHRAFNLLTRVASGVGASDSQSGFRAFSPRAIDSIRFSSDGFSVESEMQFLAKEHGLRLVEVPITADYLDKPKRPVVNHGLTVLNGVMRMVGQYRPLLFFGLPGLVVLLVGIGWGGWVVSIYQRSGQLAVGYTLISVLLTILGSLSLFAGVILHSIRGLLLELVTAERNDGRAE